MTTKELSEILLDHIKAVGPTTWADCMDWMASQVGHRFGTVDQITAFQGLVTDGLIEEYEIADREPWESIRYI